MWSLTGRVDNLPSQPSILHFSCQDPVILTFVIPHLHPLLFSLFTCYFISYSAFQSEFGVDKFLWQVFSLGILEVWVLPGWICLGAWLNGVLSSSWMSYPSMALCTTMKDSWVSTMSPTQNICGLAMRKLEWHMNCIYPDYTFCSLPGQSGTWHN